MHDLACEPDSVTPVARILRVLQVVEQDARLVIDTCGANADLPPALRFVGTKVHLKTMAIEGLATVVAHGCGQKVELHIRPGAVGVGANKSARLEVVGTA